MGASLTKETKVSKEQALSAVSDAFETTPRSGVVAIEDIVRAAAVSAERQPMRLDRWKTTNSDMHAWALKPHHQQKQFNSPRPSPLQSGGRLMAGQPQQATPRVPGGATGITWKSAVNSAALTRDGRMAKIRMMFEAMDLDGSHVVTEDELVTALGDEGVPEREARTLFREFDDSKTGRLSLAKFDHYVAVHTLALVRESFKSVDSSRDRQIQRKEFAMFFMGNGLSKKQVARLWEDMDRNKNGKINFVEYRDWASNALEMTSLHQVAMDLGLSDGF